MIAAPAYRTDPARLAHLPMLRRWIATPEVARWWSAHDPYDAAGLADPRTARWIVSRGGTPFAYLQDYDVHGWPGHHFAALPPGARGLDQFIGVPDLIGRGHGTAFLGQHMRALFAAGAPTLAVDPHPRNARAIAAYGKLGFRVTGPAQDTEWGRIVPMVASAPES